MIQHRPIAIAALLDETIKSYQVMTSEKRIELNLDNRIPAHVIVEGDQGRLMQVFANLVSNTCRYTDSPGLLRIEAHHGRVSATHSALGGITITLELPTQLKLPFLHAQCTFPHYTNSYNRAELSRGMTK